MSKIEIYTKDKIDQKEQALNTSIANKQDRLIAEHGIKIEGNEISSYDDDWSFKYSGVIFTREFDQNIHCPDYDINAEQMLANTSFQSTYGGDEHQGTLIINNLHAKESYALMCHSKLQKVVFRGTGHMPTTYKFCFTNMPNVTSIEVDGDYKLTGNMFCLFDLCHKLKTIGAFDVSDCTFNQTFNGCESLKELKCVGWCSSFDLSASTQFEESDLVEILRNLMDLTGKTPQTLTMGATNLAKLSDAYKAIATHKNWILA